MTQSVSTSTRTAPADGAHRSIGGDLCDPASLRRRLWSELAPTTQYEELLASNIVELELSYVASRQRVDGILRVASRDIVWKTLVRLMRDVPLADAELEAGGIASAFARGEQSAADALLRYGIEPGDIAAQAYRENWALLREIDHVQAQYERRRVDLMADYKAVKAQERPKLNRSIDDAEVA